PKERHLRRNMFLQGWSAKKRAAKDIPAELRGMMAVAEKYHLQANALAPSRNILRAMPMWDHVRANKSALRQACNSSIQTVQCLKANHGLLTVGEFADLAELWSDGAHESLDDLCECGICKAVRDASGCVCPMSCMSRANRIINALPARWDPRGVLPEDYEDNVSEVGPVEGDKMEFDRRVTTRGTISNVLRIFTDGTPPCGDRMDVSVNETASELVVATMGSVWQEGNSEPAAGAGIFVSNDHPLNRSIRLPASLNPTGLSGGLAVTLLAALNAD
ncbi:hypothetical protein BD310DRAFT_786291, partial [Dichomitus squalens]